MLEQKILPADTLIKIQGIPFLTKAIVVVESDEENFKLVSDDDFKTIKVSQEVSSL